MAVIKRHPIENPLQNLTGESTECATAKLSAATIRINKLMFHHSKWWLNENWKIFIYPSVFFTILKLLLSSSSMKCAPLRWLQPLKVLNKIGSGSPSDFPQRSGGLPFLCFLQWVLDRGEASHGNKHRSRVSIFMDCQSRFNFQFSGILSLNLNSSALAVLLFPKSSVLHFRFLYDVSITVHSDYEITISGCYASLPCS